MRQFAFCLLIALSIFLIAGAGEAHAQNPVIGYRYYVYRFPGGYHVQHEYTLANGQKVYQRTHHSLYQNHNSISTMGPYGNGYWSNTGSYAPYGNPYYSGNAGYTYVPYPGGYRIVPKW